MQFILIAALVFAVLVAIFALQNSIIVPVAFLAWETEASLALIILGGAALGAIVAGLLGTFNQFRMAMVHRSLRGKVNQLDRENRELLQENERLLGEIEQTDESLETPEEKLTAEEKSRHVIGEDQ